MLQRCSGTGQAIHAVSFGSKHYIQTDTVMSAGTSDCAAKQDRQTGAASTVSAGDSSENNISDSFIYSTKSVESWAMMNNGRKVTSVLTRASVP